MKMETFSRRDFLKSSGALVVTFSLAHPLQKAWVAEEVPQCGYCQSGQIMSAAALLAKNKNPSDAEIEKAMDGHICTCGTYNRIRKAIQTAAAMMRKGA